MSECINKDGHLIRFLNSTQTELDRNISKLKELEYDYISQELNQKKFAEGCQNKLKQMKLKENE